MLKNNRNFLSRIETWKSDPNAGILKSIAQIFNVDLNSLLDINNSEEQGIDKIKYITEKMEVKTNVKKELIIATPINIKIYTLIPPFFIKKELI